MISNVNTDSNAANSRAVVILKEGKDQKKLLDEIQKEYQIVLERTRRLSTPLSLPTVKSCFLKRKEQKKSMTLGLCECDGWVSPLSSRKHNNKSSNFLERELHR